MKHRKLFNLLLLVTFVAALQLFLAAPRLAQTEDDTSAPLATGYDLTWSTVDGGGYTFSSGSGYRLGGTVGQPDAGVMTGGGYSLSGGFWAGGGPLAQSELYLPIVSR